MLDVHGEEMLAEYALPELHRKRMRTTNMVERLKEAFRRWTRVIRVFPNEASCVLIIPALSIEFNDEWLSRKYPNMDPQKVEDRNCLKQTPVELQNPMLSLQPYWVPLRGRHRDGNLQKILDVAWKRSTIL